jgi:hypothetical protein
MKVTRMLKYLNRFRKLIVAGVVLGLGALGVSNPTVRDAVAGAVDSAIGE